VAQAAADAGARVINDVWGLRQEPRLAELAAERELGLVVMHNQAGTHYNDLVGEVIESLAESVALATRAGVAQERVIVDPGIGFGKTWEQNLVLLRQLGELQRLGQPILVGTSRKSFIGKLLDGAPPADRLEGTAATVAAAVLRGADVVRVHDVKEMLSVVRVAMALR